MTDRIDKAEMDALDALLVQARAMDHVPDADLLVRIVADAEQVFDQRRVPQRPASQGWFAGVKAALGGWPAMGGLAMATVAGLWIGVAPPASLTAMAGDLWGETVTVSLDPADDVLGVEG